MSLVQTLLAIFLIHCFVIGISLAEDCVPDGILRPNDDCSKFDICLGGSWSTMSCSAGEFFDPSMNMCMQGTGCIGCEKKIYDPENCRGYFTCEGANRVWSSCDQNQIFDSVTSECVVMEPWKDCDSQIGRRIIKPIYLKKRSADSEEPPVPDGEQTMTPSSSPDEDKLVPSSTTPSSPDEDITVPPSTTPSSPDEDKTVPPSTTLDEDKSVPPSTTPSSPDEDKTVPPSTPDPTPFTAPSSTTERDQPKAKKCKKGYREAIKNQCSHYLQCNRYGQMVRKRCFWFFYFNSETLRCEFLSYNCKSC